MKTFLTLLVSFSALILNGQFLKVEYSRISNTSISNSKTQSPEFRELILESEKVPDKFELSVANGNTYFRDLPKEIIYYKGVDIVRGKTTYSTIETAKKTPTKIYRLNGDDKSYSYNQIDNTEFYFYGILKSKSIDYKNEVQVIEKYMCKLVEVTNVNGEVTKIWYTEDVPVSAGPFFYNSFPGLVLKIEAPSFLLFATKVSNEAKASDVEKPNSRLQKYEGEAYTDKVKELNAKKGTVLQEVIKL